MNSSVISGAMVLAVIINLLSCQFSLSGPCVTSATSGLLIIHLPLDSSFLSARPPHESPRVAANSNAAVEAECYQLVG